MRKNKNNFKNGLILILVMLCLNCEDELIIDPTGAITPEVALSTESNVLNLLVGVYSEAASGVVFGGNSQIVSDLLGSAFNEISWNGTFISPAQFFLKDVQVDNFDVQGHFGGAYEIINQANLVLDNLEVITSSDETRQRAEGEAKFLRAMTYFDLVRLYALPYESTGANGQMGVPIRLTGILDFNEDLSIARNSVADVYNQIVSDLNDAAQLLPEFNDVFADKYAALALLARVYLQQGNYDAALNAANDVLQNSGRSLAPNFSAAFNNDLNNQEDVFAIQYTDQDNINRLINLYASQANGGRGGDIAIESGYLNLFDDPVNDERASFFYVSPDNGLLLTSKYTNLYGNISYIRIAEMHLIRLECNFRLGSSIGLDPLIEINTLRARSNAAALGSLNLDLILNERRLELGFEGHLIHDIKRTQGTVEGFSYNANNLVLPIPQAEMDSNPLMEQNPGY